MPKNNLKGVLKSLQKFGKEADDLIQDTTLAVASEIEADAKRLAPVDMGFLRNQIFTHEVDDYNYEIIAGAPYSAYMEFGTGDVEYLSIPEELRDIAEQYRGKGIRQVNIQAKPFMYPAWIKGRQQYLKDLKDNLNDLTKKYN
ncbi:MAG: HK97 gp10 family phage protein [Proteobacteria bacterium]|nr:HK97 gp10 family phage protein [Pseudomonadota bacterium]